MTRLPRSILVATILALALVAVPAAARAQRTVGHAGPGGSFGLGLVVGSPSGLSAELSLGGAGALDFALGLDVFSDRDFYFHLVYKAYLVELVSGNPRLPLYLGIGGFVSDHKDIRLGARAPLGIALDFTNAPVHVFLEAALLVTVIDKPKAGVGGAVGFHYFF
jgi:hypothetical protein